MLILYKMSYVGTKPFQELFTGLEVFSLENYKKPPQYAHIFNGDTILSLMLITTYRLIIVS